ncbi:hypothetical protein VOLCADRAFT_106122 [Volvox carteri f. nagariensis]|uniref:Cytosol aminopeptidase domain-containing protein n=1 Tax=Volvox carteri f. nagariensis TaxID=3068 RepID=D8U583_VOLCA|nr:uncharacterized protein VOLCADRAFT_106122 [Volvox carteri f. nagariensis]EFJ45167.1 hypothetical protein VOLCADRAFT_106122 [Volvox carteri f. nagariensis]|eukprot:XP_002953843.1 hypothetical protein VOLCADRAFT_106122 [Volvox carteri f. nagariensis]
MAHGLLTRSARVTAKLAARARSFVTSHPTVFVARSPSPTLVTPIATARIAHAFAAPRGPIVAPRGVRTAAASAAAMKQVAFEPDTLPSVGLASSALDSWEGDLLVLAVTEDDFVTADEVTAVRSEGLQQLDAKLGGQLAEIVAWGGFDGKQGSQSRVVRYTGTGSKAKHVAMVGLGKAAKLTVATEWGVSPFQALGAAVAALAKANKAEKVAVAITTQPDPAVRGSALTQITTGSLLGGYESSRFKSKKSPTASKLTSLEVLMDLDAAAAEAAVARGVAAARGNLLTRYLVEAPPNVCTPTHLADAAAHIAAKSPDVFTLKVYEKEECEAMGMGCYLGVAEASLEPPKFIHLKYSPPGGTTSRKIAIVGKGLTFDSGGYNLKAGPGSMIELMKFDMGGAGATLGAARILGELKPSDVEIHFIIASCENMVAGAGLRPGDILTAANGKTVEVNNTDAEGRLTLADAMWFAQEKCGATSMVDIATLTGACIIALGTSVAGLFTPSDSLAASLTTASKATGEKIWRMPMEEEYWESMKSPVADMKNTGTRYGGSITAALFLKQFVKERVEWAHLDVAGPVWNEKLGLPTGFGAQLLAEWAMAQAAAPPADK